MLARTFGMCIAPMLAGSARAWLGHVRVVAFPFARNKTLRHLEVLGDLLTPLHLLRVSACPAVHLPAFLRPKFFDSGLSHSIG